MKIWARVAVFIIAVAILNAGSALSILVFDYDSIVQAQATAQPELPRVFLDTAYAPPTGNTISVPAGGDLQSAINQAAPGDEIVIEAGATFFAPSEGFSLPPKSGTGWITIRTSDLAGISAEGTRIDPALHSAAMPKIVSRGPAPALSVKPGSGAAPPHHYRIMGIEFTIDSPVTLNFGLLTLGGSGSAQTSLSQAPHDLIIDRCYIHGHDNADISRGVALNSARTAIIDSYISEIHGRGFDTQAICGWNGPGPFKIENNYLEAAGENVLFGGADPKIPDLAPSDIEFRRNHCFKPLSWNTRDPGYAGKHWTVKNNFELKNASRILITGNVFENNWSDGQDGFAILFTPRNQDGTAPWSAVTDVTFQNNLIKNVAAGVNMLGTDYIHPSGQTRRLLIKNNLFLEMGAAILGGNGRLFQVTSGALDIVIDHNTAAFHTGNVVTADGAPTQGFVYTNNLTRHNAYGVIGSGRGSGNSTLNTYFPGALFAANLLTGGPAWIYPAGNHFPATDAGVGFVDMAGGDYRLSASSPYKNAGTDGYDPGADIDAILEAINSTSAAPPPPPPNQPPAVSVTVSAVSGVAPLSVQFTSSATDPDGQVVAYSWSFGDGQDSSQTSPAHVYQAAGSYTAQLAVTDDAGATASAQVVISVSPGSEPPVVRVLKPNTREVLRVNSIYTIKWSVSGADVQRQDIHLSLDGGSTWSLIAKGLPVTTTAYAWRVPRTETGDGRIRVTAYDRSGLSGSDMSDASFLIFKKLR